MSKSVVVQIGVSLSLFGLLVACSAEDVRDPNASGLAGSTGNGSAGKATSGSGGSSNAGGSANNASGGSGGPANGGNGTGGTEGGAGSSGANAGGTNGTNPEPVNGLPAKVVAGYYPNWTESPVRIRDVSSIYNLIYLFAAKPVGGAPGTTGAVEWLTPGDGKGAATNFNADLQHARTVQGRKIILSVGGQGGGMSFPNRTKSQTFVDSIAGLYERFGGFDGMDWNTFEADQAPDLEEMKWISFELKRRYPGFIITSPPAPWNERDKEFCTEMVKAGAMDYAAPQYYDGPNLDQQSYIVANVAEWVDLLGPRNVVVGFGIWDQTNYMSIGEAVPTWNELEAKHPTLRGGFNWQIHVDEASGWPFANQVGTLIKD